MSALDRRAFLRALGLAPLVALQGCAGDLLRVHTGINGVVEPAFAG